MHPQQDQSYWFSIHPHWVCALTTVAATSVSFVFIIVALSIGRPIDNPAGLIVYGVALAILAIPIAILNSFVVSPIIALRLSSKTRLWVPAIRNFAVFFAACIFLGVWRDLIGAFVGSSQFFNLIAWYVSLFLIAPVVAGSVAYSYRRIGYLKELSSEHGRSRPGVLPESSWPDL